MKLAIEIDNSIYDICKSVRNLPLDETDMMSSLIMQSIANGITLEKHDEEIIKETVASIWGKPPYTEVLDKIQAEIENKISSDTDNIVLAQKFNEGLITSIAIIDKYRKGQTDADSD